MQTENQKITQALETFSDRAASPENRRQALSTLIDTKFLPKNSTHEKIVQGRKLLIETAKSSEQNISKLISIAELIRLGKVVKKMMDDIPEVLNPVFRKELPSISNISDTENRLDVDIRLNVARACSLVKKNGWIQDYRARTVAEEETGEKVRQEMLVSFINDSETIADALKVLQEKFSSLQPETESPGDTIARRLTRTITLLRPIILETEIEIGDDIGKTLLDFIRVPLIRTKPQEQKVKIALVQELLYLVHDIVRTNLSVATDHRIYDIVAYCRRLFEEKTWNDQLKQPLEYLIRDIREALILLGRQGLSNQDLMDQLKVLCNYPERAKNILQKIAEKHQEIPEDVRNWFIRGRKTNVQKNDTGQTALDMKAANADNLIGSALQTARKINQIEDEIHSRLLSSLEIYDPILSESTSEFIKTTRSLSIQIENIAKIRNLSLYGKVGDKIEMSPKYFTVVGGNPRKIMTIVEPAIVSLRKDGTIGEVISKGIVKSEVM